MNLHIISIKKVIIIDIILISYIFLIFNIYLNILFLSIFYRPPAAKKIEHVNLFGASPMNIFDPNSETKPGKHDTNQ